jgi:hypothetical protein
MRFLLQFCDETAGKAFPCIAMQTRRNHQERFSGFSPGKVPEIGMRPQKRAESVLGGADKGCYGKCASQTGTKKPRRAFCYELAIFSCEFFIGIA